MPDKSVAPQREDGGFGRPTPLQTARLADDHVGKRLRRRRKELGLTQQELAATLRISYQQIQKYETGGNRISAGKLYILAKALNVDVNFFYEDFLKIEDMDTATPPDELVRMAREASRIQSEPVRKSLQFLIRALADREDQPDPLPR